MRIMLNNFSSSLHVQVYAPVSGENFNRDNVGYPASKAGNVYPPPFYMQGQYVQSSCLYNPRRSLCGVERFSVTEKVFV